jgi:hypothetical protein
MKITAITCLLVALVLDAANGPARGNETNTAPRVGRLREFGRFDFEGTNSFSARSLWLALNSTLDFSELSHPLATRDAFLAAIESHLRLGYAHCGYPDARITAHYNPQADRVLVQIKEGTRYRCGPVEVVGARDVSAPAIVEALTVTDSGSGALPQPFQFLDHAPANRSAAADAQVSSVWVTGQPTPFDDISLGYLSGLVTNALARQGFLSSRFNLAVVTNAAARTATLQVNVLEEGPSATVDRIEVTGNRRNSRSVILDYVGLEPGMRFTSDPAADVNDRLYHSARFLTNSVLTGAPDASGRLALTLAVAEDDQCPPLNAPLKATEQTLLKARDWLAKVGDTGEEAVLSISEYSDEAASLRCILSPRRGLLVLENVMVSGTNRLRHALIASAGEISLYAPERQQKHESHFSSHPFKNFITVETSAPDPEGRCTHLTASAGWEGFGNSTSAPPYVLSMSLAPAAFVRLAHAAHFTSRFEGGLLIHSNASSVLKCDSRTGRFVEFTHKDHEVPRTRMNLRFETNAYAPTLARIERDGAGFTNVCRTNASLGSAVAFFGSELVSLQPVAGFLRASLPASTCAQLPALLRRLGEEDFLSPLEDFKAMERALDDPAGTFEIPGRSPPDQEGVVDAEIAAGARWVLVEADLILPPGSWPWVVLRDIALLCCGRQNYLQLDMAEIYGFEETGPVGCLAAALLLQHLESPASRLAAARGLQRLTPEAFRRDCRVFLDERYVAGRFAARLAATLGDLNERELAALVEPMPAAQARFLRDCARRLRAGKSGQPLFETIAPALDAYWEQALNQDLAKQLKQLAQE